MQSSKSEGSMDFLSVVEAARSSFDARARANGFADADAMLLEDRARDARAALRDHRRAVVESLGGRLTDAMGRALIEGEEEVTEALRAVREWAATSKPTLILAGGVGSGKTVAALSFVCSRAVSWQMVRCGRVGAMHERWQSEREDHVEALRMNVPVMILDDLGQEHLDDRRNMTALSELFDCRKSERTRTIVTTNLTADQARKRYPEPIIDRWREAAKWVSLDQASLRRRRA